MPRCVRVSSALAVAAALCVSLPSLAGLPQGVGAGDVTPQSVVLWARTDTPGQVLFEVATDGAFTNIVGSIAVAVADATEPARVDFAGLIPGSTYYYRVTDGASASETGVFRTPSVNARTGLAFGVSGDWRGELSPYPSVKNVPGRDLDFFIGLGDTIYADVPSPAVPVGQCLTLAEFRAKHGEVYGERFGANTLGALRRSTAWFATIDDHEVTNDFAGGAPASADPRFGGAGLINDHPLYETGMRAFQEYNPIRDEFWSTPADPRTDGELRLYRSRTFGRDAAFHMLDARSFRDQELPAVANPLDPAQVTAFLIAAFDPTRTMLARAQLEQMKADLLGAKAAGVTWQFILVPEPIENLGVLAASDRFEGYAAERTEILHFIRSNDIRNVVFVSADIHGTLVNNLTYQFGPGQPQQNANSFEVVTGAVAYEAPFGPTVALIASLLGIPGALPLNVYLGLPGAQQEAYITELINAQITPLGYDPLGLGGSVIRSTLLTGGYTATNSYGWTEFEIDAQTRALTVTTWGIPWYDEATLNANPAAVLALSPSVVSRFVVTPQPTCPGDADGDGDVDMIDLNFVLTDYGTSGAALFGDTNLDGVAGFHDLNLTLSNFGAACP